MDLASVLLGSMDVLIGIMVITISGPLIRGEVKMNHWFGVRLRQSFMSEEKWLDINRFGGLQLRVWGAMILAGGLVAFLFDLEAHPSLLLIFAFLPLLLLVAAFRTIIYARRQ